jgi:Pyruvate/2-oxoglutarate dehydrogenase complex, dihydrolipoamide acyltransferase (E2) component, and related enzymes
MFNIVPGSKCWVPTFIILYGGFYGSMLFLLIFNPPQNAILGLHQIKEWALFANGSVFPREIMYVALTYDHRAISGKEAVLFLHKVKTLIEHPDWMLIGL